MKNSYCTYFQKRKIISLSSGVSDKNTTLRCIFYIEDTYFHFLIPPRVAVKLELKSYIFYRDDDILFSNGGGGRGGVIQLIQLIHFVARLRARFILTIWKFYLRNEISLSQESHRGQRQTGSMANVEPNLYYTSASILRTILQSFIWNIKPNYTISSIVKRDLSDIELIFILDWGPV